MSRFSEDSTRQAICFEYLADRPELVPQVVTGWYSAWADRMDPDVEKVTRQILLSLSRDSLPLQLIATRNGELLGTAALKPHEIIDRFPEYFGWLGSVFVFPEFRGCGVASALSRRVIELAEERGLRQLYLQTADISGGLYGALGWEPLDRLVYKGIDTLLMIKYL